jgi:uncharacterized protein with PQ loop repeat
MKSIKQFRSKKGSTLTNWVFLILLVSVFLVLFQGEVLDPMNETYGKNYSIGLSSDASSNIESMKTQRYSSAEEINDAEVSRTTDGLTLIQIGSIAKNVFSTLGDFANGRFLYVLLTDQLDLPEIVAIVLTIMIWMSLIFIMMRIFMRGVTP